MAGFAIIEAADLAEAIHMASRTPCAVAHGVEVWPLEQPFVEYAPQRGEGGKIACSCVPISLAAKPSDHALYS
jgi:hypothetical protein